MAATSEADPLPLGTCLQADMFGGGSMTVHRFSPVEDKLDQIRRAANRVYELGQWMDEPDIRAQALIILAAVSGVRKSLGMPERDIRLLHSDGEA